MYKGKISLRDGQSKVRLKKTAQNAETHGNPSPESFLAVTLAHQLMIAERKAKLTWRLAWISFSLG